MDEQEMDRIEQEQYMEDLRGYIAEQMDIIRQCTERTEEIQERLNELQEDFEWEGLPETDEVQELYAELFDLNQQLTEATERESFYRMQLFREELKEKSPSEIMELFDRISKDRIHFMKQDMEQEKNQQILKEVQEQYQIIEDHILSSDELSNLLSQRNKASKPEVSQEVMDWLEGRTDIIKKEKSYSVFGTLLTESQIIEGINEDAYYYYDIIDVIRENKTIRDLVFSKLISLDYDSAEYKDYKKLLDEINSIRWKEVEQGEKSLLQQKEAELSSLEAEERTISETEKLIAQKENEGQTI